MSRDFPPILVVLALFVELGQPGRATAQLLGTTADEDHGFSASLALHVDQFAFLDVTGITARGELPVTRRITPFLEVTVARFEVDTATVEFTDKTETSYMVGTGAKLFLLGEDTLGLPISLSAYTRLQLGLLKNIDLLAIQGLLLGTYDLTDHLPLLVLFGGGVTYRNTVTDMPEAPELKEKETNPRFLIGFEVPLNEGFSFLAEYSYETLGSGGLGLKYHF